MNRVWRWLRRRPDAQQAVDVLNAFINGALWEQFNMADQAMRSSKERQRARRDAAEAMYPAEAEAWEATQTQRVVP
jgi:hypothetical protein